MSRFTAFALVLFAAVTLFALANPMPVTVRFLKWTGEMSLALAVIAAALVGGLLVFISSVVGQQHLRARIREVQARVRELEARLQGSGSHPDDKP